MRKYSLKFVTAGSSVEMGIPSPDIVAADVDDKAEAADSRHLTKKLQWTKSYKT